MECIRLQGSKKGKAKELPKPLNVLESTNARSELDAPTLAEETEQQCGYAADASPKSVQEHFGLIICCAEQGYPAAIVRY